MFGSAISVPICAVVTSRIWRSAIALQMHHLLEVAAVVVHDEEHRDLVLGGGPQHARRVHEIAVALIATVSRPCLRLASAAPTAAASAVADAVAAGIAEPVVMLVHASTACAANSRPARRAETSDQSSPLICVPQLDAQPRRADRARIPARRRFVCARLRRPFMCASASFLPRAANAAFWSSGMRPLHRLDQHAKRRLAPSPLIARSTSGKRWKFW